MSCPSQETLSIYVDGELPQAELRGLASHLAQCRSCRASVLLLRDELAVLSGFLQNDDLAPARAVEPGEQARGLVIGLAPVLGVAALVVAVGGWLLDIGLPHGTSWLSPIRPIGVYEMTLDTIFMLRDQAPGLIELSIAVGALFAVASILTFLVGSLADRVAGPGAVLLALLGAASLGAPDAMALDLRHGEKVVVEAGDTLEDTLIVSAETVRIVGKLDGDLVALADTIQIEGVVDGNVVAVGDRVEITGEIDGSLYVAGDRVRIEGKVDDRLYGFADDLSLEAEGEVEEDFTLLGDHVRVEGKVGRDLFFGGDQLEVRGSVGRHLIVRGKGVSLLDGAAVAGDLDVRLPEGRSAEVAGGATIGGERIEGILEHDHGKSRNRWADGGFYMRSLVMMISAFLVGMLLHLVRPGVFETALPTTRDFLRELGLGFVALVMTPVAIVICFATVVGIPIGVIGVFAFLTGLFVAMILVAGLIGSAVLGGRTRSTAAFGRALLLGLLIVVVAVNLPFVGGLIRIVAIMTGVGMLVTHVVESWRLRAV